jgi:lysophospholipid acyltransferase (LPLAT)-like uncharacterized protein
MKVKFKTKLIAYIYYLFAFFFGLTYRYVYLGLEEEENAKSLSSQKNFVLALWHQNLFGTLCSYTKRKIPFVVIVSASADGEHIAYPIQKLGHVTARGSSSKKGVKALLEAVKKMKTSLPAAITVDGPRGPSKSIKPGIFQLARLSQAPILPFVCRPEHFWSFSKSWDQFRLPKPFTRLICVYGRPIEVTKKPDSPQYEKEAQMLRASLISCENKALSYLGHRTNLEES